LIGVGDLKTPDTRLCTLQEPKLSTTKGPPPE